MEHRRIGRLSVSAVGLGCNNFGRSLGPAESAAVVEAALDCGIDLFDTADVYGRGDHPYSGVGRSEEFLGRALGTRREEVVVATKFGIPMSETDPTRRGGGEAWVRRACEDSLRRLGTDYIDLYQLHRPDEETHVSETLEALDGLVREGKVRAVGCSNFSAERVEEAEAVSRRLGLERFVSVQNEYSLLRREAEQDVLPVCERLDLAFLPYFPLASGLLTGKYRKGEAPPAGARLASWEPRPHQRPADDVLQRVEALEEVARELGHTILELAFAWLLARPRVASVIAGATTPGQVRDNVAAAGWSITPEELSEIEHALARIG